MSWSVRFDVDALAAAASVEAAEIEAALVPLLLETAQEVVAEIRDTWPRRTGRSADGFRASPVAGGARISNDVPYVPHVHRRGVRVLALDELLAPAVQEAILEVPSRAARGVRR